MAAKTGSDKIMIVAGVLILGYLFLFNSPNASPGVLSGNQSGGSSSSSLSPSSTTTTTTTTTTSTTTTTVLCQQQCCSDSDCAKYNGLYYFSCNSGICDPEPCNMWTSCPSGYSCVNNECTRTN
jgi:hypothetical protein